MISTALEFIKEELASYLFLKDPDDYPLPGEITNVSGFFSPTGNSTIDLNKQIQITLVSLEEERMDGIRPFFEQNPDKSYTQFSAPLQATMYVLFTATANDYAKSLRDLSNVVGFFQRFSVFDKDATDINGDPRYPDMNINVPPDKPWRAIEKIIFKLHPLSFEQQNNLWASLGTKYLPHVVYQVRLLSFADRNGERVREIVTVHAETEQI
ncbi:Pvc16 family protein [Dyadobacter psychrophilus]|uniref:Pvc16 N-terminal domain-containing protein n=1 Tax=Dyadobacter psychrophilus TaxID=651661 RepID=A0A1T5DKT3_9BACT|nr:Pvc16 family protein [Dyadobacter psychrophilus]SKB72073.1 Protein of unknown function [Dyadobacter psychrophilus]